MKDAIPRIDKIKKIADYFGIDSVVLVDDTKDLPFKYHYKGIMNVIEGGCEGDARRLSNEDLTELIDKTYADAKKHTRLRYWHLYNLGAYSTELARRLEKETRG